MKNSNYLETKFSYFPANIEIVKPVGDITLYDYLKAIKNPKQETVDIFKEIEEAALAGNKKRKDELKAKLYYFLPCVTTDGGGRSYSNITGFTGLMIADIDNLEPEFAVDLKEYLFYKYPYVIAAFLSASKKGVKLLINIPVAKDIDEFKSYFYGLMDEWQKYKGMDFTPKNAVLANYLTYDNDLLYRLDATEWDRKGIQLDEFKAYKGDFEAKEDLDPDDVKGVKRLLTHMFNNIVDSGHPVVRSASLMAGGFAAYGYMSSNEMRDFMYNLIDTTPYLQSNVKGYKITCDQMMTKGETAPLKLKAKDE